MIEGFREAGRQPHFSMVEVVAVRGEWSAAYLERIVFGGSDMFIELINVSDRDPVGDRLRRTVLFDPGDRDAAIAVLDEWHLEIADEPDTRS